MPLPSSLRPHNIEYKAVWKELLEPSFKEILSNPTSSVRASEIYLYTYVIFFFTIVCVVQFTIFAVPLQRTILLKFIVMWELSLFYRRDL